MLPKIEQLQVLRRQLANERLKQSSILQRIDQIVKSSREFSMSQIMKPFFTLSHRVHRFKPFSINLITPARWFAQRGYTDEMVKALGNDVRVLRTDNHAEAHGCRCFPKGKLFTAILDSDDQEINFMSYHFFDSDHYIWSHCRLHCASSKAHFGCDLFLSLEVPSFPTPIHSHPFSSLRINRKQSNSFDNDAFSEFFKQIPANSNVSLNGYTTTPVVVVIARATASSLPRFIEFLNSQIGMKFKLRLFGSYCCMVFSFPSLLKAQQQIIALMSFTLKNICINDFKSTMRQVLTIFANFMHPHFGSGSDLVASSRFSQTEPLKFVHSSMKHKVFNFDSFGRVKIDENKEKQIEPKRKKRKRKNTLESLFLSRLSSRNIIIPNENMNQSDQSAKRFNLCVNPSNLFTERVAINPIPKSIQRKQSKPQLFVQSHTESNGLNMQENNTDSLQNQSPLSESDFFERLYNNSKPPSFANESDLDWFL